MGEVDVLMSGMNPPGLPSAIPAEIFREYDLRGLTDSQLTPEVMGLLGRVLARYYQQAGEWRVLVGRDNRLSSDRLRDALVENLLRNGMDVVDLGVVTTPLFYYARVHLGINAGVMITASHNPPQYNGLKVALGFATIYGQEIQRLRRQAEKLLAEEQVRGRPTQAEQRGKLQFVEEGPSYLDMLTEKIKLGPRRLKVAVDCGNGTGSLFAVEYLQRLGCDVIPLYCESDGHFPNHEPDPTVSANLRDLQKAVVEQEADVGIGFDGDSDRIGVVDDQGKILWGDELMVLYWREILPRHPGAVAITEVKCSQALVEEVERLGGRPLWYKTGHSLIKAKMKELGAVFTGEMSGHMFFADEFYGFDDAFYAAGRLLRILSNTSEKLSQMRETIPHYYSTAETRVPTTEEGKFRVVTALRDEFRGRDGVIDVIEVDGARVVFADGWALARASNTQPVIVARCEGKTPEALERISRVMKDALLRHPEVREFEWAF